MIMKTVLYKEDTRGHANHGWLKTKHTFSFARYFDPNRMNFGLLRVVNDDTISGGEGFGTHPHDNMEIVTIPLSGSLAHKDSMGHEEVIKSGEVQVMSAGTGITHSEYNANYDKAVELFQIWVFPRAQGLTPRYDQKEFDIDKNTNDLTLIVSPDGKDGSLWVNQDVWFSLGKFDTNATKSYRVKKQNNGVFAMVIDGEFDIAGTKLSKRDALGIYNTDSFDLTALSKDARILLIDVPMNFED